MQHNSALKLSFDVYKHIITFLDHRDSIRFLSSYKGDSFNKKKQLMDIIFREWYSKLTITFSKLIDGTNFIFINKKIFNYIKTNSHFIKLIDLTKLKEIYNNLIKCKLHSFHNISHSFTMNGIFFKNTIKPGLYLLYNSNNIGMCLTHRYLCCDQSTYKKRKNNLIKYRITKKQLENAMVVHFAYVKTNENISHASQTSNHVIKDQIYNKHTDSIQKTILHLTNCSKNKSKKKYFFLNKF